MERSSSRTKESIHKTGWGITNLSHFSFYGRAEKRMIDQKWSIEKVTVLLPLTLWITPPIAS